MDSIKHKCQQCRECCKFEEDEKYFAPLFTKAEIEKLDNKFGNNPKVMAKVNFKPYNGSRKVFQVELVKSGQIPGIWVCPFLDEQTHLCSIYSERNLDCKLWPFIFMHGTGNDVVFAHFDRDMCPIWNDMNEEEFSELKKKALSMLDDQKVLETLNEHPELVWQPEQYTTVISRHKMGRSTAMQTF